MSGRLVGRRVVVTRPAERAGPLIAALEAEGSEVVLFPTIEVRPATDPAPLERAAERLRAGGYDWVVFTSPAGVTALRRSLEGPGARGEDQVDAQRSGGPRIACVGGSTAEAAEAAGWTVSLVPEQASGEALGRALVERFGMADARVLFPRAEDAREAMPELLRSAGARVDDVIAYRKIMPEPAVPGLAARIRAGEVDALTFTSPSTVRNFERLLGTAAFSVPVAVIGPITGAAVVKAGGAAVVAEEASVAGLVEAVVRAMHVHKQREI